MRKIHSEFQPGRRELLKMMALGSTAGFFGLTGSINANAQDKPKPSYTKGMAPVTIKNVKAIATAPEGINLIVVKVETTEPGLYGLGCATFTQRAFVSVTALDKFWIELGVGRVLNKIEAA